MFRHLAVRIFAAAGLLALLVALLPLLPVAFFFRNILLSGSITVMPTARQMAVDELEKMGIVGGYNGAKPRKVLMTKQQYEERKMRNLP